MECQAPLGLEPGRRLADPSRGFGCLAVGQACPARPAKRSARGGPSARRAGRISAWPRCDRFSSKDENLNFGLYYYGFRWNAPTLQRWMNRDPIGEKGGINLYSYVRNALPNAIDAFGLELGFTYNGDGTMTPPGDPKKLGCAMQAWLITTLAVGLGEALIEVPELMPEELPPGWTDEWEWGPPTGEGPGDWRWFDPNGGEWRYHAPDRWHSDPHWDYNPWDSWNSPWQNIGLHGNLVLNPSPRIPNVK